MNTVCDPQCPNMTQQLSQEQFSLRASRKQTSDDKTNNFKPRVRLRQIRSHQTNDMTKFKNFHFSATCQNN